MLATHQLQLRIGPRVLLNQLDWQVAPGECWAVIGRNGVGKSTLLRTLAGLQLPGSGRVSWQGRTLPQWPLEQLAHQRGYLPQVQQDAFAYRVLDLVLMARHPYHADAYWENSDDHRSAQQALVQLEVAHLAQRDVRSLSGGERQRVAIAALLAQDTPLLLLDEPGNALDLGHQVRVMQLLRQLCREQQKSVVVIAHDLNMLQKVASHALLLMGDGSWLAGTVAEVMQLEPLGRCLGHPLMLLEQQGQRWFMPHEPDTA